MDQTRVASIRKKLEAKSTEELRQAYDSSAAVGKKPEELEAIRQLLAERSRNKARFVVAVSSAVALGGLGAAGAWQQGNGEVFIVLAGVVGAILGFASWYIRDLPFIRV